MIDIKNKQDCCGCSACVQRCPKRCIELQQDEEGFLYPFVNKDVCIDCGLCEKVCPVIHQSEKRDPIKIYGCKNRNATIRMTSSSGGLFFAIASQVIGLGGVVFGVKFNSNWEVVFSYTENLEGLKSFQGSKYVQAYVGNSFLEVESFIKTGRIVLFSGTSCQVAGLKKFLRKEYFNLITLDFICHGVPSQKLFQRFLLENSSGIKDISYISFRNKNTGWKKFSLSFSFNDKDNANTFTKPLGNTTFGRFFLTDVALRPSCYCCPAKSGKSQSDITMADFWGVNESYPNFDDDKGITLAIINSQKGYEHMPFDLLEIIEPSHDEAFKCNGGYYKSVSLPRERESFFMLYEKCDTLDEIQKILYHKPFFFRVIKKILRILKLK